MTCPKCGAHMTVDPTCQVEQTIAEPYHLRNQPLTVRLVTKRVALCDGCEYVTTTITDK